MKATRKSRERELIQEQFISIKEAITLAKKFRVKLDENSFKNIEHGEEIFRKKNIDSGIETHYFLQRYFKQTFDFYYSCKKGGSVGKELIMSNVPMPDIEKYLR